MIEHTFAGESLCNMIIPICFKICFPNGSLSLSLNNYFEVSRDLETSCCSIGIFLCWPIICLSSFGNMIESNILFSVRKKILCLLLFFLLMHASSVIGALANYFFLFAQLAWTCYNFYQSTPTKLAGENYFFSSGQVIFLKF